ncbi:MAG: HlyD family efflux transporter periplasmic adaptor subunit [bacterium]|nr:HlyD family efflux transporter periplasmic adaptor subunit [bacterium]
MKNIILGAVLPAVLVVGGIALVVLLQVPEPTKTALPDPNNEGELLAFLPIAEVAEVKVLAETLDIEVSGTVEPYREVQLAAEAAGRIVEKCPDLLSGNYVKQGQLLYKIDPRDYELEIERLTRRRDQELASIEELQQDIENAEALLTVAEQELELAAADVKRFESMNKSFSSAAELDQARRSRLSSLNQKVTLQNQLRSAKSRRSRLELAAKLAETELEQAKLNLSRTIIHAPVDGRVVSDVIEVDSFVQRGTQLLTIEDTEKVEVACSVRMDQLSWILDQPNVSTDKLMNNPQSSRFELPITPVEISYSIAGRDSTTYIWDGVLDRVEGVGLDPLSRTIPIRIRVDNPGAFRSADGRSIERSGPPVLVRGMFVNVVIKSRPSSRLMLVPKLSIKPSSNASVIWKFSENREVVRQTPKAREAIAEYEKAEREGRLEELYVSRDSSPDDASPASDTAKANVLDPAEWDAGNLKVIENVRMVTQYTGKVAGKADDVEYWVCEVPSDQLLPGDRVIISPLPGVRADGTDPVRVRRVDEKPNLASGSQEDRNRREG